jgi:hypothetical protein
MTKATIQIKQGDLIKSIDMTALSYGLKKCWKLGIVIKIESGNSFFILWQTGKLTSTSAHQIWNIDDDRMERLLQNTWG